MIENSKSAHRSQVWLVKTPEGEDAVIVSFVDQGSEDPTGIYFYKPGAYPVELLSVDQNDTTVTVDYVPGSLGVNEEWPGDELVPRAELTALSDAAETARWAVVQASQTTAHQLSSLRAVVRREHEASATSVHSGPFGWCRHPVCQAAQE